METSARNALKSFDRYKHVDLPHKTYSCEIFWKLFNHILSFLNGKMLLIYLNRKSSSESVSQASSFGPTLYFLCISNLFNDVLLIILVSTQNVTNYLACWITLR